MKNVFLITMSVLTACLFGCGEQTPTQAFGEWRNAIVSGKIDAANEFTQSAMFSIKSQ